MGLELSKYRVVEEQSGIFVELYGLHNAGVQTLFERLAGAKMEDVFAHGAEGLTLKRTTGDVFIYFPGGGRCSWRPIFQRRKSSLARYGLIFVIDSSVEGERYLEEVHGILYSMAHRVASQDFPFLLLANKQDKEDALTVECVKERIQFDELLTHHKKIRMFGCSTLTGEGVDEAMDWLFDELSPPVNTCTEDTQEKVAPQIEVTAKPDHKSLLTMFKGTFTCVRKIFARNTKKS